MTARAWMEQGTAVFLTAVGRLPDDELGKPTALPGWTRRHVIAHVHYNAEALRRLVRWARTGEPAPMYRDRAHRAAEIESGAQLAAARLRTVVHDSAAALAADFDALQQAALTREVTTAQGRSIPAGEIPWLRTREVAVHAVDLDAGVNFADLPGDLNTALVSDVVARRCAAGEAAPIAAWLTGRASDPPVLGPWL